jgi:hypothetical protein
MDSLSRRGNVSEMNQDKSGTKPPRLLTNFVILVLRVKLEINVLLEVWGQLGMSQWLRTAKDFTVSEAVHTTIFCSDNSIRPEDIGEEKLVSDTVRSRRRAFSLKSKYQTPILSLGNDGRCGDAIRRSR